MSLNPVRSVVALLLLVVASAGVVAGARTFLQDIAFTRVQTELSFWGRGAYRPDPLVVEHTGNALEALLRSAPEHPEFLELRAHYLIWQAYWSTDMDSRQALGRQALEAQQRALLSRPANRQGWSKMVEYTSRISGGDEMLQVARQRLESLLPRKN